MTRIVLLALLLATGGAIVNVAVAWGLEFLIKPSTFKGVTILGLTESGTGYKGWIVHQVKRPHVTTTRSSWRGPQSNWGFIGERPSQSAENLAPRWAQQLVPTFHPPSGEYYAATAWECGWPAQSMGGVVVLRRSTEVVDPSADNPVIRIKNHVDLYRAAVPNPALLKEANSHQYARPLVFEPLWPGFAINTIFYAAVLWMLFAFPFVMRRRRRIKRGLCPACAYPVGGSPVCTECGKLITHSSGRIHSV